MMKVEREIIQDELRMLDKLILNYIDEEVLNQKIFNQQR